MYDVISLSVKILEEGKKTYTQTLEAVETGFQFLFFLSFLLFEYESVI